MPLQFSFTPEESTELYEEAESRLTSALDEKGWNRDDWANEQWMASFGVDAALDAFQAKLGMLFPDEIMNALELSVQFIEQSKQGYVLNGFQHELEAYRRDIGANIQVPKFVQDQWVQKWIRLWDLTYPILSQEVYRLREWLNSLKPPVAQEEKKDETEGNVLGDDKR